MEVQLSSWISQPANPSITYSLSILTPCLLPLARQNLGVRMTFSWSCGLNLFLIQHQNNRYATQLLVQTMVISHIDNCNALLTGLLTGAPICGDSASSGSSTKRRPMPSHCCQRSTATCRGQQISPNHLGWPTEYNLDLLPLTWTILLEPNLPIVHWIPHIFWQSYVHRHCIAGFSHTFSTMVEGPPECGQSLGNPIFLQKALEDKGLPWVPAHRTCQQHLSFSYFYSALSFRRLHAH